MYFFPLSELFSSTLPSTGCLSLTCHLFLCPYSSSTSLAKARSRFPAPALLPYSYPSFASGAASLIVYRLALAVLVLSIASGSVLDRYFVDTKYSALSKILPEQQLQVHPYLITATLHFILKISRGMCFSATIDSSRTMHVAQLVNTLPITRQCLSSRFLSI